MQHTLDRASLVLSSSELAFKAAAISDFIKVNVFMYVCVYVYMNVCMYGAKDENKVSPVVCSLRRNARLIEWPMNSWCGSIPSTYVCM